MIVREATAAADAILAGFLEAIIEELWDRPWPPPELAQDQWQGKVVLLAEDDDKPIGFAAGEIFPNRVAHVAIVYVRPERRRQGIASELLRVFSARAREAGPSTSRSTSTPRTKSGVPSGGDSDSSNGRAGFGRLSTARLSGSDGI